MIKQLWLLIGLVIMGSQLNAQSASELIKQADAAVKSKNETNALNLYKQALKKDPKNIDALCGASLYSCRVGNRQSSTSLKKGYFNAAKIYAQSAVTLAPTNSEANYVMSVAMGRIALISGTKEKVAASRAIKKYADLSVKYNPKNAGAWHVLGRWNYGVATLNFAEKTAAKALFGGIPNGTIDEAISCLKKSMALDPSYLLNYQELGRAYMEKDMKEEAKKILLQGMSRPSLMEDDDAIKAECKSLLNSI